MKNLLCMAALLMGLIFAFPLPMEAQDRLTIGYQLVYNPWKVAISEGAVEQATQASINWRQFDSGAGVVNAMASGAVQVAMAGSSPIAAGLSRGLDLELVWIFEDIAAAEALVVRNGTDIVAPQDLVGKKIAVPVASTTHFHVLFALEQFGLSADQVEIVNLQPPGIIEAWNAGGIDAAFIWDPVLGEIKKSGKVLITSGLLSSWGKATFDGMVVDRSFAEDNAGFMCKLIKSISEADESYRSNPGAWGPESGPAQAIAELVGGEAANVPIVLDLYDFPTLDQQVSTQWLGGGGSGGAARALRFTAEFLKAQGKVRSLPEDFGRFVNPAYAEMVLNGAC
ncbi:MAG: taurine ABC transporter substrate-binding protein [Pseudomonadota bacterium]